jgi:hypothetical protein
MRVRIASAAALTVIVLATALIARPSAQDDLKAVRSLIAHGDYSEAERLARM